MLPRRPAQPGRVVGVETDECCWAGEYFTDSEMLSVDARTGELVQDVALGSWNRCAIEDADRDGVLLSYDETVLAYHRRVTAG